MQRRRDKRRVHATATSWWKGMGNLEECPQEWGHGSLKGYATVVRRRINELRRGFRREQHGQAGGSGERGGRIRSELRSDAQGGALCHVHGDTKLTQVCQFCVHHFARWTSHSDLSRKFSTRRLFGAAIAS